MAETKASLISIGEKLMHARENKGLTIDQVRKQTHMHSSVLIALEEGKCDEMLSPTYIKSFLKKYAQYLGLDAKEILKEYSSLYKEDPRYDIRPSETNISSGPNAVSRFIYILTLILVVFVALFVITVLGQKVIKSFKGAFKAPWPARHTSQGRQSPKPKAVKSIQTGNQRPAAISSSKTPAPQPAVAVSKKMPLNLVLKVKQPVLIKVKRDGVILFSRVLPKGLSESFTADDKIELYVAKAEAIELVLNGKSLGSPGRGLIKNLEVTNKGIKIK